MTEVMRKGLTLRDFFEEIARCHVPGLPFVDENGHIIGRISVRDVFDRIAIPDRYRRLVDAIGDQTDRLDLSEKRIQRSLTRPVERYVLDSIPSVTPASSLIKALAIMEAYDTHYIFLLEDDKYMGVITRMVIAERLLEALDELE